MPFNYRAAFSSRSLHFRDVDYRFALWDTAGQERFRSLAPLTYRTATAAIIVYDITDQDSFEDVDYWMGELRKDGPESILVYVVGNKIDLESSRVVDRNAAEQYASNKGAFHFQSSAKSGSGVEEIFFNICQMFRTVMYEKGIRRVNTIRVQSVDDSDVRHDDKVTQNGCRCKNT